MTADFLYYATSLVLFIGAVVFAASLFRKKVEKIMEM